MDNLNKTIKKLTDKEYQDLLEAVTGNRKDKPYLVIENARFKNLSDSEMIELLGVNNSTYYTLKSRLNSKVASVLAKSVENPISVLQEKVSRVQANLYGTNKSFSIKALQDLEKELIEYDLSNELIIVYKTLARLHLHNGDYNHYQRLYDKHVAFSLAVTKAEDVLYDFTKKMSTYLLTRDPEDLDACRMLKREAQNIYELYESHRLYIINNIIKIYFWCKEPGNLDELRSRELEVDGILQEMNSIFNKYNLDTFYQNIKPLVDLIYFEYYTKTKNIPRADHHYKRINTQIPDLSKKHIMSFYVTLFLDSKVRKYLVENNIEKLVDLNDALKDNFEIDKHEIYNLAVLQRFFAICKFYEGDYASSAKIMNEMRNEISLRNYLHFEVECKLFQALQYCLLGNEDLCNQFLVSITRQIPSEDPNYEPVKLFMKVLKNSMKTTEFRQKIKKITESWQAFEQSDNNGTEWMWFIRMDDQMIRRLANPMK